MQTVGALEISTGFTGEQLPGFDAEIREALAHVTPYDDEEDAAEMQAGTSVYRGFSDEQLVVTEPYHPHRNEVITTNTDAYWVLLSQAYQAVRRANGRDCSTDSIVAGLDFHKDLVHERVHGWVMRHYGHPTDTTVYYGVSFHLSRRDGLYKFVPFAGFEGPLAKVHDAWSALAVVDPSLPDRAIVRGHGYDPDDKEGLRLLAEAVPPVPEDWRRRPDLIIPIGAMAKLVLAQAVQSAQR